MFDRLSIKLAVVAASLIIPPAVFAQAVDVPLDIIIPIEFDSSLDIERPDTVSLPQDFLRQAQLGHVRSLLDAGDHMAVMHHLSELLRSSSAEDTVVAVGSDHVGLSTHLAQLILQLPPNARAAYVAQFEPEAANALAIARERDDQSFANITARFPTTPSANSAILLQAMVEYDRGRPGIAIAYLRRLQEHAQHGTLPANAKKLAKLCQQPQPQDAHVFANAPASSLAAAQRKPMYWTAAFDDQEIGSEFEAERKARVAREIPAIPSSRAIVNASCIIGASQHKVEVFDRQTGAVRFRVAIDHPPAVAHFDGEGLFPMFAVDDDRLLVVQRYKSDRTTAPNRSTQKAMQIATHVFPVWPPDDYMGTPVAVMGSTVAAYDSRTGTLQWQTGGLHSTEIALRDAAICGTPVIDQDEVFLISETDSTLRLVALDAFDGHVLWTQQIGWADTPIDDDPDRLICNCRPAVFDDVILCPTAAGKLIAVNRSTRSLQWAFEYNTTSFVPFEHHHMAIAGKLPSGRWLGKGIWRAGDLVILSAPDSNELLCIDIKTGRSKWTRPRGTNLHVAHIDENHIWTVGMDTIIRLRTSSGLLDKSVTLPSTVTGLSAVSGENLAVATTQGIVHVNRQTVVASKTGRKCFGNLMCAGATLIDSSPQRIRLLE